MGEFYKPAPIEVQREVREVNGVLESFVPEESELEIRSHLDKQKAIWVERHLAEVAKNLTQLEDSEAQAFAAD